jgi:hypothetical protein
MNIIVRDADNVVVMCSINGSPEPDQGCHLVVLDEAQAADFDAVLAQPNGGVTFDGESFSALPAPPPPPPLTPAQKLEAAGLTVAELKTLLGL